MSSRSCCTHSRLKAPLRAMIPSVSSLCRISSVSYCSSVDVPLVMVPSPPSVPGTLGVPLETYPVGEPVMPARPCPGRALLRDVVAAVDDQAVPGDVRRSRAAEERDGGRHLHRIRAPAHRGRVALPNLVGALA